jgi:hypothetical protein
MSLPRVLLTTALLVAPTVTSAATMRYVSLEHLTQLSAVVARGTVAVDGISVDAGWGRITTTWSVQVSHCLVGDCDAPVVFHQWGGELDGVVEAIPGDAAFQPGEDVLVFLRRGEDGRLWPTALAQSRFAVEGGDAPAPGGPLLLDEARVMPRILVAGEVLYRDLEGVDIYREGGDDAPEILHLGREYYAWSDIVSRVQQAAQSTAEQE